jgi:hypothetical protein
VCYVKLSRKRPDFEKTKPAPRCRDSNTIFTPGKVASINVKRSQYIRIENPLHKQSEKACMCFKTRRVRTRDFTICTYLFFHLLSFLFSMNFVILANFKQFWIKIYFNQINLSWITINDKQSQLIRVHTREDSQLEIM